MTSHPFWGILETRWTCDAEPCMVEQFQGYPTVKASDVLDVLDQFSFTRVFACDGPLPPMNTVEKLPSTRTCWVQVERTFFIPLLQHLGV